MPSKSLACVKYITCFCNFLFVLTGFLVLLIGVMVHLNYSHYSNFGSNRIWSAPLILIIVGAILIFTCFLGCCGSLKENNCMILAYILLAVILILFEIGLGIAGYVKHNDLKQIMEGQFNVTIAKYMERHDYRDAWSLLQTELECCGIYGPTDWESIYHNNTLPASCCPVIILNEADNCTYAHSSSSGCFNKLLRTLDSQAIIFAVVALGVAVLQVLIIFFACCLHHSFRQTSNIVCSS